MIFGYDDGKSQAGAIAFASAMTANDIRLVHDTTAAVIDKAISQQASLHAQVCEKGAIITIFR